MAVARAAEIIRVKEELLDGKPSSSVAESDPLVLEEKLLSLCSDHPKGVSDETIVRELPFVDAERRMKSLQRLLSQGKIDLLKQGSTLVYRLKATSSQPSKTKGFEKEERVVYQIIEDSQKKGIWIRDIRMKSNLPLTQITRCVKLLESRKLVKSVRSVQQPKKKVYMLYDLSPDESVTGGAWYSDQDFESEFVDVLNQHCCKFLQQKAFKARATHKDPLSRKSASFATIDEVCSFITALGISKVPLTAKNIESILDTLLYDGKAETTVAMMMGVGGAETERHYRAAESVLRSTGLSRVPCGICPVIDQCCDGGAISPSSCVYMNEWLRF